MGCNLIGIPRSSIMRTLVTLISLSLIAPAALANPQSAPSRAAPPQGAQAPGRTGVTQTPAAQPPLVQLAPIDLTAIPEACKPLAKRVLAPRLADALAARISLASCMAERAIAPLQLCDCADSVVAIDGAAKPALALLDDVIANGDAVMQVLAEHAVGRLYDGFAARMMATLPAIAAAASESEIALRDMRKQTLEAQLAPWREAALASFEHVIELAKAHPALTRTPATATAVRDSQQRLAAEVASR
jgi:hypothetical protein